MCGVRTSTIENSNKKEQHNSHSNIFYVICCRQLQKLYALGCLFVFYIINCSQSLIKNLKKN